MRRLGFLLFLSCHADPGGVPFDCSGRVSFEEDFEGYAAGAALDSDWTVAIDGPNVSVAIATPDAGHGAGDSQRYLLIINNGMPMAVPHDLSAATPPRDLSGCQAVRLQVQLIVFSLEANEMDAAYVELRADGRDWQVAQQVFPGIFTQDTNCRPGNQDTTPCVAWMPFSIDIPPPLLTHDFQARFHLHTTTDVNDAIGVDDVRIVGVR